MSEALLFSVGSLLFVLTTSATFAFGLVRFREVQIEDLAQSGRYPVARSDGLTELHVSLDDPTSPVESVASTAANEGGIQ